MTGKYHGKGATDTERASGVEVEIEDMGPLKPGGAGHSVLRVYGSGDRLTAYDASMRACGDYHARRRESTRTAHTLLPERSRGRFRIKRPADGSTSMPTVLPTPVERS